MSDCPPFSVFCGQVNDFGSENKTTEHSFSGQDVLSTVVVLTSHLTTVETGNRRDFIVCVYGFYLNRSLWEKKRSICHSEGFLSLLIRSGRFVFASKIVHLSTKYTEGGTIRHCQSAQF